MLMKNEEVLKLKECSEGSGLNYKCIIEELLIINEKIINDIFISLIETITEKKKRKRKPKPSYQEQIISEWIKLILYFKKYNLLNRLINIYNFLNISPKWKEDWADDGVMGKNDRMLPKKDFEQTPASILERRDQMAWDSTLKTDVYGPDHPDKPRFPQQYQRRFPSKSQIQKWKGFGGLTVAYYTIVDNETNYKARVSEFEQLTKTNIHHSLDLALDANINWVENMSDVNVRLLLLTELFNEIKNELNIGEDNYNSIAEFINKFDEKKGDVPEYNTGKTILNAFEQLPKPVLDGMNTDTQKLIKLQSQLMQQLQSIKPALKEGFQMLEYMKNYMGDAK